MTVRHALDSFLPTSGDIHQGLDVLNDLFGKILYRDFPVGQDWLDHLDVLGAVRLNHFGSLKKIGQYYPEQLSGYVDVGIEKNSADHNKAIDLLKSHNLSGSILIEHAFNSGYVRLCVSSKNIINELSLITPMIHDGKLINIQKNLTEEQKQAIHSIYDLYSKEENIRRNNVNLFLSEWDKRSNLKTLREWWDNIPTGFTVTSVGKVLAHSNAQRCDKSLPPLD